MEWISVRERLPENAQPVLIAEYRSGYSRAAMSGEYFTNEGFIYIDPIQGIRKGSDVRYWMLLPEVPES